MHGLNGNTFLAIKNDSLANIRNFCNLYSTPFSYWFLSFFKSSWPFSRSCTRQNSQKLQGKDLISFSMTEVRHLLQRLIRFNEDFSAVVPQDQMFGVQTIQHRAVMQSHVIVQTFIPKDALIYCSRLYKAQVY